MCALCFYFYFSQLSAFTILIIPADVYAFGPYVFLTIFSKIITVILANWIFIPIFYNNKFDNCYNVSFIYYKLSN